MGLCTIIKYAGKTKSRRERMPKVAESARSMLLTSNLPREMWSEAVNCANYVLNRVPSKATPNKTPHEHWFNRKPDLSHLRVFGSHKQM
jgi:hypothetical protein